MRFSFFYHAAFIVICSIATTSIQTAHSSPSFNAKRAEYGKLLKIMATPAVLSILTLGGQQFTPRFLQKTILFYAHNPYAFLSAKKLRILIKKVKAFYKKQKQALAYNQYFLVNPRASNFSFNGMDLPETIQFGHALCTSLAMLHILICTSTLHDKTAERALDNLQRFINEESDKYKRNNPKTPDFIERTYELIGRQIDEAYASSTDASEDDEAV